MSLCVSSEQGGPCGRCRRENRGHGTILSAFATKNEVWAQRCRPSRRSRGSAIFILLELLVAIAIIGLLLAILLPSLNLARLSARRVECAAHLRQLGVGWTIYADQNKGHIVPGRPAKFADPERNNYWLGNGYHFGPRWFVQMGAEAGFHALQEPSVDPQQDNVKLVDGNEVFLCPSVPERTNSRNYAYGRNRCLNCCELEHRFMRGLRSCVDCRYHNCVR